MNDHARNPPEIIISSRASEVHQQKLMILQELISKSPGVILNNLINTSSHQSENNLGSEALKFALSREGLGDSFEFDTTSEQLINNDRRLQHVLAPKVGLTARLAASKEPPLSGEEIRRLRLIIFIEHLIDYQNNLNSKTDTQTLTINSSPQSEQQDNISPNDNFPNSFENIHTSVA